MHPAKTKEWCKVRREGRRPGDRERLKCEGAKDFMEEDAQRKRNEGTERGNERGQAKEGGNRQQSY